MAWHECCIVAVYGNESGPGTNHSGEDQDPKFRNLESDIQQLLCIGLVVFSRWQQGIRGGCLRSLVACSYLQSLSCVHAGVSLHSAVGGHGVLSSLTANRTPCSAAAGAVTSDDVTAGVKCGGGSGGGVNIFSDFVALVCSKDSQVKMQHLRHQQQQQPQQQQLQVMRACMRVCWRISYAFASR